MVAWLTNCLTFPITAFSSTFSGFHSSWLLFVWWWFCSMIFYFKAERSNLRIFDWDLFKAKSGFPNGTSGNKSACQFRRHKRPGFNPWVGKILWSRKWQPTPVLLPGKFCGRRSLACYSPGGHKELDTPEWLSTQAALEKSFAVSWRGGGGIRLGASSPLASLTPPATTGEEPAAQLGPGHLWSQKEQEVLGPDHWAPEQ